MSYIKLKLIKHQKSSFNITKPFKSIIIYQESCNSIDIFWIFPKKTSRIQILFLTIEFLKKEKKNKKKKKHNNSSKLNLIHKNINLKYNTNMTS